ncbi:hypothetical protein [Lignipirellula cremea]|uniref:Uncharacterized protein n=1 Tax=Lignipirellula cremea TaxID=2528010 RepID=A0A518DUH5_9BACT|nr:hypothetical protein [Lignipirellula cremea]QDU95491.1 hypothetical protein Pla8534_33060 [Lignipirellula cremea]
MINLAPFRPTVAPARCDDPYLAGLLCSLEEEISAQQGVAVDAMQHDLRGSRGADDLPTLRGSDDQFVIMWTAEQARNPWAGR